MTDLDLAGCWESAEFTCGRCRRVMIFLDGEIMRGTIARHQQLCLVPLQTNPALRVSDKVRLYLKDELSISDTVRLYTKFDEGTQ